MVFIKGGCYHMGDSFGDGNGDETPVHEVCVDDYYLGEHEVTVGEFREFVNETSYRTDSENIDGCYYWTGFEWKKDRKIKFMESEHGEGWNIMGDIKRTLDPKNILNPGKLVRSN